ncbi:MAG: CGNR zinc finger domain-containing protein [Chloroflexota bacterium]
MVRTPPVVSHDPDLADTLAEGPHGHQASLAVGLAFVNTLEHHRRRTREHLPAIDTALRWLRSHLLLHQDVMQELIRGFQADPSAAEKALARIHRVRAAMRELADATVERRPPDPRHLDRINRALRTPYTYVLVPSADGVSMDHKHEGDPVEGALARLVESIAREVSQGHPERIRVCANEECRWVFQDTSRSGRRKWCDMARCGNRAKVARHREKQRNAVAATDEAAALDAPAPMAADAPPVPASA